MGWLETQRGRKGGDWKGKVVKGGGMEDGGRQKEKIDKTQKERGEREDFRGGRRIRKG